MRRPVDPGDLISVSQRLRRLMAAYDDASYDVAGSFTTIDPGLEARAAELRRLLSSSGNKIFEFLEALEETPAYRHQMSVSLERKLKNEN
jgi:hypothetical protein